MRYHFGMGYMHELLKRFEVARPFTEAEAWMLFRLAAFSEAAGWTLLIAGILIKRFVMHGNDAAVLIAGQIHGMLFFAYFVAALGLYPSLSWSRWRALFAVIASVPPYGTLVIEQWAAHQRKNAGFKTYQDFLVYKYWQSSTVPLSRVQRSAAGVILEEPK
jgi:integral membrane protein